uniref:VP6 n=1 Tax=Tarumizu tick virus TaxID=2014339 RepID=A0A292G330_9REOV|nr:VP6 [Tarumizu tick virus]
MGDIQTEGLNISGSIQAVVQTNDGAHFMCLIRGRHCINISDLWNYSLPEGWIFGALNHFYCFVPADIGVIECEFFRQRGVEVVPVGNVDEFLQWYLNLGDAVRVVHHYVAYLGAPCVGQVEAILELGSRWQFIPRPENYVVRTATELKDAFRRVGANREYAEGMYRDGGADRLVHRAELNVGDFAEAPAAVPEAPPVPALPPPPPAPADGQLGEDHIEHLQGLARAQAEGEGQPAAPQPPRQEEAPPPAPAPAVVGPAPRDVQPFNLRENLVRLDALSARFLDAYNQLGAQVGAFQDGVITVDNLPNFREAFNLIEGVVLECQAEFDPYRLPGRHYNPQFADDARNNIEAAMNAARVRHHGVQPVVPGALDEYNNNMHGVEWATVNLRVQSLNQRLVDCGFIVGLGGTLQQIVRHAGVNAVHRGAYIDPYVENMQFSWHGNGRCVSASRFFTQFFYGMPDLHYGLNELGRIMRDLQTRVSSYDSVSFDRTYEPNDLLDLNGMNELCRSIFVMLRRWHTLALRLRNPAHHRNVCMELARRFAGWGPGVRYTIPAGVLRVFRTKHLINLIDPGACYTLLHYRLEHPLGAVQNPRECILDLARVGEWANIHDILPYMAHFEFWEMFVNWFPDRGLDGVDYLAPVFPTYLSDRELWTAVRLL